MQKRIFIGVPLPSALQNEIENWTNSFLENDIRWVKGDSLHITLLPPWYVDDFDDVVKKLNQADIKNEVIEINLKEIMFGPNPKRPRFIWVCGDQPNDLIKIKEKLEHIFKIRSEFKPWKMHVTLGRFEDKNFRDFKIKDLHAKVNWKYIAQSIALYESQSSKEGTEYKVIKAFPII